MKAVKRISWTLMGVLLVLWNDLVFAQDATTNSGNISV